MGRLTSLAPELLDLVMGHLELGDLVSLSCVSSQLRAVLAPSVFRCVHFTNADASCTSALLALRRYGRFTARLKFDASTEGQEKLYRQSKLEALAGMVDKTTVPPPVLPQAVREILAGTHTPGLYAVELQFTFSLSSMFRGWDDTADELRGILFGAPLFLDTEDEAQVLSQERMYTWRALLDETWRTLARNGTIRELVVHDLMPKVPSAFGTADFAYFLGRLETLRISIFGLSFFKGTWGLNLLPGYMTFLASLDTTIFAHLRRLKRLAIHAPVRTISGQKRAWPPLAPLPLTAAVLPALQHLELGNCFVDQKLVDFVRGRSGTLASLTLKDCMCGFFGAGQLEDWDQYFQRYGVATPSFTGPTYWAGFFQQIYEAKPSLSELVVDCGLAARCAAARGDHDDSHGASLSDCGTLWVHGDHGHSGPDERQKRGEWPRDYGGRTVFSYASIEQFCGHFRLESEHTVEAFERGDDQEAYDRLMALVRQNASASGRRAGVVSATLAVAQGSSIPDPLDRGASCIL